MDAKLATREFRLQQWMAIFHDRSESGLTIKQYCEERGISRDSYFYWQKIARNSAIKNSNRTTFAELNVSEQGNPAETPNQFVPQLTISLDRFTIGVDSETPKGLLTMALEAISDVK